jgi:hypothetical protein
MSQRAGVSLGKHARLCGWVGVAALAAGIVTAGAGALKARHPLPEGVQSPILALELLRHRDDLPKIARPDPPADSGMPQRREADTLATAVRLDSWIFIPAYTIFLGFVGWLVWRYASRRLRVLGVVVIVTTIAGAVFDWRENAAMLAMLANGEGHPRPPSLIKWTLLSVAIACSTPIFLLGSRRLFLRAIGYAGIVWGLWAGLDGVLGVRWGNDQMIEAGAGRMSATFVLAVLFLLGLEPLKNGIIPALDALARKWPFNKLVDWPTGDRNETVGESVFR